MTIRRRRVLFFLAIIAVIFAVAAVLAAVFLNPAAYRSRVVSYLEGMTGEQVDIGHLSVQWRSGLIELDDFGIRNPRPFPGGYFIHARRVEAHIRIAALLRRKIVIESIALQDPVINVISDPDGLWNFQNPHPQGSSGQPAASGGERSAGSRLPGASCLARA